MAGLAAQNAALRLFPALYLVLTATTISGIVRFVNNQNEEKKTMQKLNFTLDLTPVELRGMAATLLGMAAQIERNLSDAVEFTTTDDVVDEAKTYDVDGRQYTADQIRNGGWDREQLALCKVSESDILEIYGPVETEDGTTTGTTDVELDKEGLPWDARIHAPSKLKLKREKTWKLKKSVDPVLVETVKKELREAMAAPAATTENSNVTNIADAKPKGPAGHASPTAPAKPAAPEKPVVEVKYVTSDGEWTREQLINVGYDDAAIDALPVAEQTVPVNTEVAVTFPELMQLVTPALAANTITEAQIVAALPEGITSLTLLSARPDLVTAVKVALFG